MIEPFNPVGLQNFSRKKISHSQKPGNLRGNGVKKDFLPLSLLFQSPSDEYMDHVSQKVSFLQVMGYMEGSESKRTMKRDEQLLDLAFEGRVEGRQRFIQEKQPGRWGQGPSQGDSLFFPSAQTLGIPVEKGFDFQGLDQMGQVRVVLLERLILSPETVEEIFHYVQMGEKSQILRQVRDPPSLGRQFWKLPFPR